MITPRVKYSGDTAAGQRYLGFAKDQLRILKRQMSFQKLNEGVREVKPLDGVVVRCTSSFNHDTIEISVKPPPTGTAGRVVYSQYRDNNCLCTPMFSMGVIVDEAPAGPRRDEYETLEDFNAATRLWVEENTTTLRRALFKYGVNVCVGGDYEYVPGVPANGWARYYIGQQVLVTVGYFENDVTRDLVADHESEDEIPEDFEYCSKVCLMDHPRFKYYSISPLHIEGMPLWIPSVYATSVGL